MYHPTTRLLTVLELLQCRDLVTGAELAERLEVDPRSVRRYIAMLQDLGIPIEGARGSAGGYRLRPGYKLPPLLFSAEEGVALTLGLLGLRRSGLDVDASAVEGALAKVARVLPDAARGRVRALQTALSLEEGMGGAAVDGATVATLSEAAEHRRRVAIRYRSGGGEETGREIDPYGVVSLGRHWYVVGYCHLRADRRVFRLDRIGAVALGSGDGTLGDRGAAASADRGGSQAGDQDPRRSRGARGRDDVARAGRRPRGTGAVPGRPGLQVRRAGSAGAAGCAARTGGGDRGGGGRGVGRGDRSHAPTGKVPTNAHRGYKVRDCGVGPAATFPVGAV